MTIADKTDINVPDDLMGRHFSDPLEIRMWTQEILEHNLTGISRHRDEELELENMPDILIFEVPDDFTVKVLVPLPYLHHADVSTDQIQEVLAPCISAGVKLEVEVHPGSDHEPDGAKSLEELK